MGLLLRAELLKLRTTRTFVILIGVTLALSLTVLLLFGLLGEDFDEGGQVRALFSTDFTGFFIMLLGIIGMCGEWRHRTITGAILAAPDRLKFLTAKTLSYAVAGVVVSLIVTLTLMALGSLIVTLRGFDITLGITDYLDVLWRNLAVAALLGALGVCVGAVVRNQIAAVIGIVILAFPIDITLALAAPDVWKFGPIGGAPTGLVDFDPSGGQQGPEEILSPGIAALVMFGWLGAFFVAAGTRLRRFDLV